MLEVILCLAAGLLLSRFLKFPIERFLRPLAYSLIFLIGLEIGSENFSALPEMILQSLAIALSTISGSIIALYLLKRLR
jgi:uncharacterized membrane protein YbjE (DUF340 family)